MGLLSTSGSHRYTVIADVLFDGSGVAPLENAALTIDAGRITSVTQRGRGWSPPAHEVHDFSGCTVAPGLIDSHCHLALQPELGIDASILFAREASENEIIATMSRNAAQAFACGVTTLRDCGSPGGTGVRFRATAAESRNVVPRVLVSGRPITTRLGHCHWMGLVADSQDELRDAVATLADEGVDFIKVMATGGMMTSTSNPYGAQYSADELAALVGEAHRRSKLVAAHVLSAEGLRAAISARVDTIEHCVTTTAARRDYDPSLNVKVVEANIIVGVTAHFPLRSLLREGDLAGIRQRLTPHRELRAAGARLTVHTDAGTPGTSFDSIAESIEIFRIGLDIDVAEALKAATTTPAAALGIGSETGLLASGFAADFIVLDGDVERDISALRRVVAVARDGVLNPMSNTRSSTA